MKSEIIAVGSEMLTPFRQDTNSLYITEKLNGIGITVAFKSIVGDRQKDLVNAIRTALGRVDILILMGGLGPTEDDLTREAVAEALSLTLRRDASQVAALHARAAGWRITMPQNNLKQADVLEGATLLPNPNGSAPGQWLDTTFGGYRKLIALLPGPPHECRPLFDAECMPRLSVAVPPRAIAVRTLKAAMIPESQADKLLAPVYTTYTDVETTLLAHTGDLQITLICSKQDPDAARQRVDELAERIEEKLEDWLYSSQGDSLEQIVLYYLELRQATLAVAESCTGGLVAERITSVPGASRVVSRRRGGLLRRTQDLARRRARGIDRASTARSRPKWPRRSPRAFARAPELPLAWESPASPAPPAPLKPSPWAWCTSPSRPAGLAMLVERTFRGDRQRIREWAAQQALDLVAPASDVTAQRRTRPAHLL